MVFENSIQNIYGFFFKAFGFILFCDYINVKGLILTATIFIDLYFHWSLTRGN